MVRDPPPPPPPPSGAENGKARHAHSKQAIWMCAVKTVEGRLQPKLREQNGRCAGKMLNRLAD